MARALFGVLLAVSLLLTEHGVLAAPQRAVGSFSLPLRRKLVTGSTEVTGYTDDTGEYVWLVDVEIRDQTFSLELATGSQTSWVWSNQIAHPPQGGSGKHTLYDYESISPSPLVSGSSFDIKYEDVGSDDTDGISGPVVQDTVSVAGVEVDMQFGAAKTVPGEWFFSDGLLALGWSGGSAITNKPPSFIELVMDKLALPVFTTLFDLKTAGGTLAFGNIDPAYSPSLKSLAVDNKTTALWLVRDLSFLVKGQAYKQPDIIFDTASPVVAVANETVTRYWKEVPNAVRLNATDWATPCDASLPDLHFTSPGDGEYEHVIPGESFMGARAWGVPAECPMCHASLVAESCTSGCATMGAPFFGTHYVVWNIEEPSIAIALKEGERLGSAA